MTPLRDVGMTDYVATSRTGFPADRREVAIAGIIAMSAEMHNL